MSSANCVICGSGSVRIHLDDDSEVLDPTSLGSSRTLITHGRILRCSECGFAFRQMRSDEQALAQLYRQMDPSKYEAEAAGRARTAARHLRIVQGYAKPGRILDVGCASGLFLDLAQRAGWRVVGVEPSETLFEKARATLAGRGELFCETLERAGLAEASFEAITMWDVLEHVTNPSSFLSACRALLKPATFVPERPRLGSLQARVLGPRWPLLLAEHLNYFDRNSLKLCGEKAGLTWIRFGRRCAYFSVEYVLCRLSQHHVPGAKLGRRLARGALGRISIPVSLGETFAVWQRR